ncbi:MAG: uracil-DNA glycosylase family protein [Bacilli bacterium]|nr:uracil-DNA glycosylase family protein [Bacilli bacterium]MDD4796062.1 uracil-DNA glycosylase family protein [Bacilli bacterium]
MKDNIKKCKKCSLYLNQSPLIQEKSKGDILWLGLSAKKISDKAEPLSNNTNTGKIIEMIESKIKYKTYKTNLVKCLPLNNDNKLRYPTLLEKNACYSNLALEIKSLKPKIIILLGSDVADYIAKKLNIEIAKPINYNFGLIKYNNIFYIHIYHPSYIYVYKKKELNLYTNAVVDIINLAYNIN